MSRTRVRLVGVMVVMSGLLAGFASGAYGVADASSGVSWLAHGVSLPTAVSSAHPRACVTGEGGAEEEKCDRYQLLVLNTGEQESTGTLTLKDTLPEGITLLFYETGEGVSHFGEWSCSAGEEAGRTVVTCEYFEPIVPGHYAPFLQLAVSAPSGSAKGELVNKVSVEGGGAEGTASTSEESPVSAVAPPFEVSEFAFEPAAAGGEPSSRASTHPWEVTTDLGVPSIFAPKGSKVAESEHLYAPVQNIKSTAVEVPLGFLGDAQAAEKCTETELVNQTGGQKPKCPAGSRVGVSALIGSGGTGEFLFSEKGPIGIGECCSAVYNMVPQRGYPAVFGFVTAEHPVLLYAGVVHTPAGYRVRVATPGVPSIEGTSNASVTLFGEPGLIPGQPGVAGSGSTEAFLSNPADCAAGVLSARVEIESWSNPGHPVSREATAYPGLTGCNALQLAVGGQQPSLSFEPAGAGEEGTSQADSPSAFTSTLEMPQATGFDEATTPPLKNVTVLLPAGVSLNPAAGQGLESCQATGPEGINIGTNNPAMIGAGGQDLEDPEATELGAGHPGGDGSMYDDGLYHVAKGHCPAASTVGTIEAVSPLLAAPLHGHLYVATPKCGGGGQEPCTAASATNGELFGAYLELEGSGVIVKIPGKLSANTSTGQLTASFDEAPQFPVSRLTLKVHGGPRAPLAEPQTCGQAGTNSTLEPWSSVEGDSGDAFTSFSYQVTGCAASMPFAPSFTAGSASTKAGAYTPFSLAFSRQDGEQDFLGLEETMPEGLLAKLAGIPLCPEEQANKGTCSEASEIGTVTASAGAGSTPIFQTGKIYLTGPYNGGPFGEAVVVPAVAGPFNLGDVVVRGSIRINPTTGQATVVSDPFPTILDGVPLRVKSVNVTLDREAFTFNPTNCVQKQVTATFTALQGASARETSPFASSGCSTLGFKPTFTASTQGKTSKLGGASLTVKISQAGGEANIHRVDVQLPAALPSRLTTLQKACLASVFNANPASCPEGSDVGTATAHTPLLNAPLTGPAYLVARGSEFPDLEFVLQGEGVKITLDGETIIKKGITYSKFETVPDAPISSFETSFPEGPHSALAANVNLCAPTETVTVAKRVTRRVHGHLRHVTIKVKKTVPRPLVMPTTIEGQNGTIVKQTTSIAVTECPAAKASKAKGSKAKATKR
jgi:hypothetical protein